ncbi:hypothetical protein [Pseudoduganella sp.]|uniref:hypothetical protein n=1 Tax=Pseudoduganella sp. TaxID=1880898 RepID=UPI0035B4437C
MAHSPVPSHAPDQLDSAWKCALDQLIGECLATCFPALAAVLDLSRPFTILDGELHQPSDGTSPAGNACHADRVYQCFTRDGRAVCLHVEVQCQHDEHFAQRVFIYHALLFARHKIPVISLVILGDGSAAWRPCEFGYGFGGCELTLSFATVKLLDLKPALPALLQSGNGFALFAAAHLEIMQTKGEPFARLAAKCRLTRTLCGFGWQETRLAQMLELLDRLMPLPKRLDGKYRHYINRMKGMHMLTLIQRLQHDHIRRMLGRAVSHGNRIGREEGRKEGLEAGLRLGMMKAVEARFGPLPADAAARMRAASPEELHRWVERLRQASSLDELMD